MIAFTPAKGATKMLQALDHVNVRTANLDAMIAWYVDILGMTNGARPNFGFPGAWLYLGDRPLVHLVGEEAQPQNTDPQIEHFAFRAEGFETFCAKLDRNGVTHRESIVPGIGITQVNVWDPDGNHIHIDFQTP